MILFLLPYFSDAEANAGATVQLDFTPFSATDASILEEDLVHRLAPQAHRSFTPWVGYRHNQWLFLSSLQYNIWEYRSWSETENDLQNLGQLELQQQFHRIFEKDELLLTTGIGFERNFAISNRRSTLFTEEEQKDYDEQAELIRNQIESLGFSLHFSIQYPLPKSLFLGLGYDAYSLFQMQDHNGLLQLNTSYYSRPKLFLRVDF